MAVQTDANSIVRAQAVDIARYPPEIVPTMIADDRKYRPLSQQRCSRAAERGVLVAFDVVLDEIWSRQVQAPW